ncbi:MAG: multiheme c-type cytochrome [Ignavibacteria bacterium]
MRFTSILSLILLSLIITSNYPVKKQELKLSDETQECINCHSVIHPGIVASWEKSRHSKITPEDAITKTKLERRVSFTTIEEKLKNVVVGCYECHSLNTEKHSDAFEHNGYKINLIISPNDCAVCHPTETNEYSKNLMSFAHSNLVENKVYQDLMRSVNNPHKYDKGKIEIKDSNKLTDYESCLYCHGSKIEVKGFENRETQFGELTFPVLEGWPNQGVGRINPDGSRGSCSACHTRHEFSIEIARKPYTCAECHKGPDVPAFKVYEVSKHGNIFSSEYHKYNFDQVPWRIGKDFSVPTCATCHISLITSPDGKEVIVERTHQMNDRLSWRLFGVPYAHPHPIKPNLSDVKNSAGLPLIVELNGEPVNKFVISREEQEKRNSLMKSICLNCHSKSWVNGHFERLENTIKETNALTLQATKILQEFWANGFTKGLPHNQSSFDEKIERDWVSTWLYYANSIRFASAMAGGGDYGVFADGRYQLTEKLYEMKEMLELRKKLKK